jgi:Domain of unknown function (DUF1877)
MSMTFVARRITADDLSLIKKTPDDVRDFLGTEGKKGWSFSDQMYAAINYCVTGDAWGSKGPGAAIHGGKAIGPQGNYGPVRYVEPAAVVKVSELLAKVSKKGFLANFEPEAMNDDGEIYPPVEDDDFSILWERFCDLRALYDEAANAGDAMLLSVD